MRWGERAILGGLVLAVMSTTVVMVGRQLDLKKEQDTFGMLREKVEEQKNRSDFSAPLVVEGTAGAVEEDTIDERAMLEEYQELYKENTDFAGWITIEGTNIDYPVMQNLADREYYLHRDFYKRDSYAGVPFVGTGDMNLEEGPLFLYGHNMKNGTMFADLLNYQSKDYWEKHSEVLLDTLWDHRQYKIFAVLRVSEKEWTDHTGLFYSGLDDYQKDGRDIIKELKDRAIYETGTTPSSPISLLYLITCSYQQKNERFVVVAERADPLT